MRIAVINGPNLNMLGVREPDLYGKESLSEINASLTARAEELGHEIIFFQSNHEGELVDNIQQLYKQCELLLINAAAYSHTSIAIRDALSIIDCIKVEVHLSHVHARDEFRHRSMTAAVCDGFVSGFGAGSYLLALEGGLKLAAKH